MMITNIHTKQHHTHDDHKHPPITPPHPWGQHMSRWSYGTCAVEYLGNDCDQFRQVTNEWMWSVCQSVNTHVLNKHVSALVRLSSFVFFTLRRFWVSQMTVKKTLSNFRRTHHDNWQEHKQQFTDDQLVVLTDLLVSPCYYA